jgi:hypothetical protein
MVTIRLLSKPRRAWLTGFGLCASAMTFSGFAVIALREKSFFICGVGACLTVAVALAAHLWPWAWTLPYRAWNKLAKHYGDIARLYFLGLCYLIVSAVGLAGPSKDFTRDPRFGSGWISRKSSSEPISNSRVQGDDTKALKRGWIRTYVLWAIQSGQIWRCALLPFLILLSMLGSDERSHVPTQTYTLF